MSTHKVQNKLKLIQINLQKSSTASASLEQKFIAEKIDIALVTEPNFGKIKIRNLKFGKKALLHQQLMSDPELVLFLKTTQILFALSELCSSDLVAANLTIILDNVQHKLVVCSAYHDAKNDAVPELLKGLIEYYKREGRQLIYSADANSKHVIWGSRSNDSRGEKLLEFLISNEVEILNPGNEATYDTLKRFEGKGWVQIQSCIDLTIVSRFLAEKIIDWRVSKEHSGSDHKYIEFSLDNLTRQCKKCRNPRKTNWLIFKEELRKGVLLYGYPFIYRRKDLDVAAKQFTDVVLKAYYKACPESELTGNRNSIFFNSKLQSMKEKLNKLWNKGKSNKKKHGKLLESDMKEYRSTLYEYQVAIEDEKLNSWKRTADDLENISSTARLPKFLSKEHQNKIGTLRKKDKSFTKNEKETLQELAEVHFPGAFEEPATAMEGNSEFLRQDPAHSYSLFTEETIRWSINEFQKFKSAGPDEIFPALLQEGIDLIIPILRLLFVKSHQMLQK